MDPAVTGTQICSRPWHSALRDRDCSESGEAREDGCGGGASLAADPSPGGSPGAGGGMARRGEPRSRWEEVEVEDLRSKSFFWIFESSFPSSFFSVFFFFYALFSCSRRREDNS